MFQPSRSHLQGLWYMSTARSTNMCTRCKILFIEQRVLYHMAATMCVHLSVFYIQQQQILFQMRITQHTEWWRSLWTVITVT
jgi:hypothetical protein